MHTQWMITSVDDHLDGISLRQANELQVHQSIAPHLMSASLAAAVHLSDKLQIDTLSADHTHSCPSQVGNFTLAFLQPQLAGLHTLTITSEAYVKTADYQVSTADYGKRTHLRVCHADQHPTEWASADGTRSTTGS